MKDLIRKVIKAFFTSLAVTAGAVAVCFLILFATGNRLSWTLQNILVAAAVVVLLPAFGSSFNYFRHGGVAAGLPAGPAGRRSSGDRGGEKREETGESRRFRLVLYLSGAELIALAYLVPAG